MTWYWFPDNTVLCNFASVDSLSLLQRILRERGRWTEAIAYEARRSARFYPDLDKVASEGWLGAPIEIDDEAEAEHVERIRRVVFGGSASEPLKHLGEAQTCHIIRNWAAYAGSYWITDDRDALEYARRIGITARDTADLISEGITDGCCTRHEGYRLLHLMRAKGRNLRIPPNQMRL
ncbi:unnamed protein product [[Actinomadura] parvosata subsp. kistnae]|uniref:PIN domain-containing protein n=1 Tax=[Actinomadura] parvosata subsp. kistnae TaxID=1909395 RepID=A0A1V0A5Z3_9ACTN|nr:hypothetical protein [Nonomuraea sp. ATCC 55076]AQZ65610.1 hypothetical protein BKM31_32850 [Nonomuraea sp. ATCC 55076]SPL96990.1 unnamed protein product [Actinomadura parvosata subsp. kistnae]